MEGQAASVTTSALYGIFVSHKSYIIGKRCCAKWEYSELMAEWVSDHRFPEEVVEVLHQKIYDVQKKIVLKQWKHGVGFGANAAHFANIENSNTMVQAVVQSKLDEYDIKIQRLAISRAGGGRRFSHLLHLSASKVTPSLAMSLPSGSDVQSGTTWVTCQGLNGPILTGCRPSTHDAATRDIIRFHPDRQPGPHAATGKPAARLMQFENVEESIAAWDAETIEDFVDSLNLRVLSIGNGEPLKPSLHLWQRILDTPR